MKQIVLPFYARLALVLLVIVLIVHLLVIGKGIFIPLFFSLMLAFLLYPLALLLETRLKLNRGISAFISISVFVGLIVGFIYLLIFQILGVSQDIPLLQAKINAWLAHVQQWIIREYQVDGTEQVAYLHETTNNLLNSIANSLGGVFIGVTEFLFWAVLVFIYTYFIMYYRRLLLHFMMKLFPREHRTKVRHVIMETRLVTNYYLQGLLIEFVIMAVANSFALYLLGVKYALLLGLIAALLNFIPYLGILIATIIVMLVALSNGTPDLAIKAGALLFFLHILDANILMPKVVGNKVKMNTLMTIISVLIGGVLWGVAGLFLAIPISAMLKIVFDHVETLEPWGMLLGVEDKEN